MWNLQFQQKLQSMAQILQLFLVSTGAGVKRTFRNKNFSCKTFHEE